MCRLLFVNSEKEFDIEEKLEKFSIIAKNSTEYQGDGWGICYYKNREAKYYHSLDPIWEDRLDEFGSSKLIMVHARSAFEDDLKPIEHNMPFYDSKYSFIFNGELRGVRIKAEGRIGAEKMFNYIKRFDKNGLSDAIMKFNKIIERRTDHIRGMNYIMTDSETVYINSFSNEDRAYFTLYKKEMEDSIHICSEKFAEERGWESIPNKKMFWRKIK